MNDGTPFPPQADVDPEYVENTNLLSFYWISYHYIGCVGYCTSMIVGFTVSLIIYHCNGKQLTEAQQNPRLHFFVFDHFLLRWLPKSLRDWARCGMVNPDLNNTSFDKVQNNNEKIDEKRPSQTLERTSTVSNDSTTSDSF